MAEYEKASPEVIEIAERLIKNYHPSLKSARIAFMFVSKAPTKAGKIVLGSASLVSKKWQVLLPEPYDFLIVLSADQWFDELDKRQKAALIDHELCHCVFDEGAMTASIRGHCIEEFDEVILRHGAWLPDIASTAKAMKIAKVSDEFSGDFASRGLVKSVDLPSFKADEPDDDDRF